MIKVDENLFYKGVDKRAVHGARLHQSHSLTEPGDTPVIGSTATTGQPASEAGSTSSSDKEEHPPYPFESGNTLLALTKKHNVGRLKLYSFEGRLLLTLFHDVDDHRPDCP